MAENWNEPIDKLRKRIEGLQGKTDDIDKIIPQIEKDLQVIEKGLQASKEMIEEEAAKQPLIEKSVNELGDEITKLEGKIAELETNQKALKGKTAGIAAISVSIGAIAGISVWVGLKSFKDWLSNRPSSTSTS